MAATTAFVTLGLAPAADAATGDTANSSGQFLSGSLLTGDLSNVAGIGGAQASYTDGVSPGPYDEQSAGLDLTALNTVGVSLPGGVSLPLGDLLSLGAVNQYAWAGPDGVSRAASGAVSHNGVVDTTGGGSFPSSASLDLTQLLGSTTLLSAASLDLQGVTGVAALDGSVGAPLDTTCADLSAPVNCRDYNIAGATLDLQSPLVGQFTTTVDGAITTLDNSLADLANTIETTLDQALTTVLDPLGGTVTSNVNVTIDSTSLDAALSSVLQQTVTGGGVSINLITGEVTVDLAQFVDLNNLPPNSTLLSPEVLQAISAQVATLLDGVQAQFNTILATALDNVNVQISGGASVTTVLPPGTAGVDLSYNGSLQDLLSGTTPIGVTGTGATSVVQPILSTLPATLSAALAPLLPVAETAVSTAGTTIDGAVTTLTNGLSDALTLVASVAEVIINVQEQNVDGAGTFTETAVRVNLLGDTAAQLNLGKAVVGPNTVNTYTVTLAATDTPAGQSTTVTGGGWPANTDVQLQLRDPAGNPIGSPITVTTDANGNIPAGTTIPVPADAPPGTYSVLATDAGGETAVAPFQVTDATAPNPPVIQSPVDGSSTNDPTPVISGTAEAGSTVTVTENGATVCTATAAADGTWSCTPTTAFTEGPHTITATATDAAGNVSDPSAPVDFTVDTTAPAAPVITSPVDGSATNDSTPAISGTGEAGDTVAVMDGAGNTLCTATVATDGTWTCDSSQLPDGTYTITATQTDPAGNTSPASAPVTFTVDTTAPAAPVITGPADGSTVSDSTPTITGTGEPGATVTVTDGAGDTVCTATVDANGQWTCDSTVTFADGPHTLTATQTDPAGNTSPASAPVTFTVDTAAPAVSIVTVDGQDASAPVDTTDPTPAVAGTAEPGATVDVTVTDANGTVVATGTTTADANGNWSFTPTTPLADGSYTAVAQATDAAGNTAQSNTAAFTIDTVAPAAPVITSPVDGSSTNDSTPAISGTGEAGDTVTVTDGAGNTLCTATVATDGTWTCDSSQLPDGTYTITATQTDPAGNTSPASDPVTFTVDTQAPAAPVITGPADGSTTSDSTPPISGTGEVGDTVTVTDETNNTVVCTATVQADGTWTCTPGTALADGPHTITATQTDAAGNTSPASDPVTFTVDTTAPAAPVITGLADGSTIADNTPTISGTGEAGATVTVTDAAGDTVCTATVAADGTWSCVSTIVFADGPHTVTATQTDAAGNTSPVSDPVTFTVDATAPAAPVITGPADGTVTSDNTPTISGTGEPGATVTVIDQDGTVLGSAVVDPDGNWSFVSSQLPDGDYTITATQTDAAGNTSPASAPDHFTVDTTAPAAPVISGPADGSTIADNTPTISGTGEAGASVTVADAAGDTVCTTTVAADGTWSCESTIVFADGPHTVTATQTDAAGNTSPVSDLVTFTVDATAPAAPVITGPADGTVTSDNTPTISGTGEPAATVTVTDQAGTVLCTATVAPDGTWMCDSSQLPDGSYTITATQTDAAGNISPASAPDHFTVDTTAPAAPVITGPADGSTISDSTPTITGTGEAGASVTVTDGAGATVCTATVDANGQWTCDSTITFADGPHTITATQTDPAGNTSPESAPVTFTVDSAAPVVSIDTVDGQDASSPVSTNDTTPSFTGTTEPTATVEVTVTDANGNVVAIGTTTADGNGNWSFTPVTPLLDGGYTAVAQATDAAGNTALSNTAAFTIDTVAPAAPVITGPADGSTTNDSTPTISGTGEPGATVTVTDAAGDTVCTATVAPDGTWSCDSTITFADGPHTLTATQIDAAGNTSPASDPVTFTVDTQAPAPPVITGPADGSTTNDNTPTISGTGEPGDTVTVTDGNGDTVCTAVVQPDGNWSCTPDAALADGQHTLTATQTDPAGNRSAPSAPVGVVIDSVIADPTITSPADGSTITDRTPTVTGTGDPGSELTLRLDGQDLGTVTVGSDGTWSIRVTDPLGYGGHTLRAVQRDAAGNVSNAVTSAFTLAPAAPTITSPDDGAALFDTSPPVQGTGKPGAQVTLYVDQRAADAAIVAPDGSWAVSAAGMGCGRHTLTASQSVDAGAAEGMVASPMSDPVTVTAVCSAGAQASAAPGSSLAPTGAPTGLAAILALGLGLVVAGGLLLMRRRRS